MKYTYGNPLDQHDAQADRVMAMDVDMLMDYRPRKTYSSSVSTLRQTLAQVIADMCQRDAYDNLIIRSTWIVTGMLTRYLRVFTILTDTGPRTIEARELAYHAWISGVLSLHDKSLSDTDKGALAITDTIIQGRPIDTVRAEEAANELLMRTWQATAAYIQYVRDNDDTYDAHTPDSTIAHDIIDNQLTAHVNPVYTPYIEHLWTSALTLGKDIYRAYERRQRFLRRSRDGQQAPIAGIHGSGYLEWIDDSYTGNVSAVVDVTESLEETIDLEAVLQSRPVDNNTLADLTDMQVKRMASKMHKQYIHDVHKCFRASQTASTRITALRKMIRDLREHDGYAILRASKWYDACIESTTTLIKALLDQISTPQDITIAK